MTGRLLVLLVVGLATACDGEPAAESPERDDWSGPVVTHSPEALSGAQLLDMVEVLRLGSLDGPPETQFFRVTAADIAGDELFILDAGHSEVRVFDLESGEFLRKFGRAGDGPGEFRNPSTLEILGDTLVVAGLMRMSRFELDGTFHGAREAYLRTSTGPDRRLSHAGRTRFITESSRQGMPPEEVLYRDTTIVRAVDPRTAEAGEVIFRYPDRERLFDRQVGIFHTPMFSPFPVFSAGADGRLYYTPNDAYRIDVVDAATGEHVLRVESPLELPPVTRDMIDQEIADDEEALRDARERESPELQFYEAALRRKDLPVGERRTLTNGMRAAEDGRWALIRGDLDANPTELGDPGHWDVFGPDGAILGRFVTAPGANVRRFTGDYVITRETDDLGVQSVIVYRLEPAP